LLVVDSQAIDREATIPDDVLQLLKDFGMFGMQIPQEYGMSCFTWLTSVFSLVTYVCQWCTGWGQVLLRLWSKAKVLGHVAPTWFMISDQLNLDQELNRVHVVLHCTNLNLVQLTTFSWTGVIIRWTMLIGQATLGSGPSTVTSQSDTMLMKQSVTDWP